MSNRSLISTACMALATSLAAGAVLFPATAHAADVAKTRQQQVLDDQKTVGADSRWVYNDLDKGIAQAKRLKKPILLVFR